MLSLLRLLSLSLIDHLLHVILSILDLLSSICVINGGCVDVLVCLIHSCCSILLLGCSGGIVQEVLSSYLLLFSLLCLGLSLLLGNLAVVNLLFLGVDLALINTWNSDVLWSWWHDSWADRGWRSHVVSSIDWVWVHHWFQDSWLYDCW